MSEMYFSVPYGTREMSFGIANEGEEIWNFYLIFIESVTMGSRQVIAYGDYRDDGIPVEMRSEIYDRQKDFDDEFEIEFDISKTKKVKLSLFMTDRQYTVHVNY